MSIIPSPDQKNFCTNERANGEPLDCQQWRSAVIDRIEGFHFGPHVGPLLIPGTITDQENMRMIHDKLIRHGWVVFLCKINEDPNGLLLKIHHPDDPHVSVSSTEENWELVD